jgi:hypothetical protein
VSVDVWFTQDIGQIILAAVKANEDALAAGLIADDPLHKRTYHQGFRAALSTVALALGLPQLPPIDDEEQCSVVDRSVTMMDNWPTFVAKVDESNGQELIVSGVGQEVACGDGAAVVR